MEEEEEAVRVEEERDWEMGAKGLIRSSSSSGVATYYKMVGEGVKSKGVGTDKGEEKKNQESIQIWGSYSSRPKLLYDQIK